MLKDLTPADCDKLLASQVYGHLGCYADQEVYVVPATYVYEADVIYSYTHDGKKIQIMRLNNQVCFQTESMKSPQDWQSVICWGMFEEVRDKAEQTRAIDLLTKQFADHNCKCDPFHSPLVEDAKGAPHTDQCPIIYKITITKKTGKRERPPVAHAQ